MSIITGDKEFFKGIGQIKYEGPQTDNPLAYRWYDAGKTVAGKTMKEHLRFAVAYWHSFVGNGADPFGEPTHLYAWNEKGDAVARAKDKMDAAFEFITKLDLPFYCFHDVDVVDYTNDVVDNEKRLQALTEYAKQKQAATRDGADPFPLSPGLSFCPGLGPIPAAPMRAESRRITVEST